MLLEQIESGKPEVAIQYSRAVRPEGNPRAMAVMEEVFETGDAEWRGLGKIGQSGLFLRREYGEFDARKRFSIPELALRGNPGLRLRRYPPGDHGAGGMSPLSAFLHAGQPRRPLHGLFGGDLCRPLPLWVRGKFENRDPFARWTFFDPKNRPMRASEDHAFQTQIK